MARRKLQPIDCEMILSLADKTFTVLPLLRKRLLQLDQVQAAHNMPLSHIQVLHMLSKEGTLPVSDISKRLGIAKPNVTPVVDAMIASGYLERTRVDDDRRKVNISILPAGREKMGAIDKTLISILEVNLGLIKAKDFRELDKSLDSVLSVLGSMQE